MKNKAIWMTLIIVVGIMITATTIVNEISEIGGKTLNSEGIATIKSQPDEVSVIVNIETLDNSAELSKQENQDISSKVMQELNKDYIDKVETQSFSIYEEFDYTQTGRRSKGFKTSNILKITTKDFGSVGKIIDLVVDSGATGISGINFELSEASQEEIKKEALEKAAADAKAKAEATASGLNTKIGEIVSVSTSNYNYNPYPILRAEATQLVKSVEDVGTEISPQELEVTARVNVVFKVE